MLLIVLEPDECSGPRSAFIRVATFMVPLRNDLAKIAYPQPEGSHIVDLVAEDPRGRFSAARVSSFRVLARTSQRCRLLTDAIATSSGKAE